MNVEAICTRAVRSCGQHASLAEAGNLMGEADCGALPVVDDVGKVVGIVTDRDLCLALSLTGRPAADLPLRILLHSEVHTCRLTDGVREALRTMRTHKVRRLPVVDGAGLLQGILSISDLALAAKPDRHAGPSDVTDEDVSLAMKTIFGRTSSPRREVAVPSAPTLV